MHEFKVDSESKLTPGKKRFNIVNPACAGPDLRVAHLPFSTTTSTKFERGGGFCQAGFSPSKNFNQQTKPKVQM